MKKETTMFIADLLTETLKEETRNYQPIHYGWVQGLINATKDFYEDNGFYMGELNRLIENYKDTKNWIDTNKGE